MDEKKQSNSSKDIDPIECWRSIVSCKFGGMVSVLRLWLSQTNILCYCDPLERFGSVVFRLDHSSMKWLVFKNRCLVESRSKKK